MEWVSDCQGTGGLAETCALDVPAEPGLGRTHKTWHLPALRIGYGKLSSAHSLDPCWFQDQANESEAAAGVLPEYLGRDSGGVRRGVGGWRGRLFIHQTGCRVQNSVLTRQALPSGLRPQQR